MIATPVPVVAGLGQLLQHALPNFRVWRLENTDTGEVLEAQYEPLDLARSVSSTWAQEQTLNRQGSVSQYLHGNPETITFGGRFFNYHIGAKGAQERLDKLIRWAKRDEKLGRPPICQLTVGEAAVGLTCFIESITDIRYDRMTALGTIRGISFTITLLEYQPFTVDSKPHPETRYHRAKRGEYYELLCFREYGNPLLGDVIRKRHPERHHVREGDTVRLPSAGAIRRATVEPTSIPLKEGFGRRMTPQKALRQAMFERAAARPFYSHILGAGF